MDESDRYQLTGRFLMGRLRHALSDSEKQALESLVEDVQQVDGGTVILSRGDLCDRSTMLIDGFMLRTIHQGSQRFVVGMQVPGDFPDLHAFALKRLDHDLVTLGPARIGSVAHGRLVQVMEDMPHLARLLWFSTLLDAAIHREWVMKLQQLPAPRRAAHMFCELWQRLDFVGLGREDGVHVPLTQADLADMCGTTAIHMNRALGQMRKEGVADFKRGKLIVPSRAALNEYALFDPSYLYGSGALGIQEELSVG